MDRKGRGLSEADAFSAMVTVSAALAWPYTSGLDVNALVELNVDVIGAMCVPQDQPALIRGTASPPTCLSFGRLRASV